MQDAMAAPGRMTLDRLCKMQAQIILRMQLAQYRGNETEATRMRLAYYETLLLAKEYLS